MIGESKIQLCEIGRMGFGRVQSVILVVRRSVLERLGRKGREDLWVRKNESFWRSSDKGLRSDPWMVEFWRSKEKTSVRRETIIF